METKATILHADLDAFFANLPVSKGQTAETPGKVDPKSSEAKEFMSILSELDKRCTK